jgi:hypothetical protein
MDDSIDIYWTKRLERCRKALEGNGFDLFALEKVELELAIITTEG